jgi:hypothetical protein
MKSEQVAIVAAAGTAVGAYVQSTYGASLPFGAGTGYLGAVVGAAVAVGSYLLGKDGISDAGIGFGVGWAASAVL